MKCCTLCCLLAVSLCYFFGLSSTANVPASPNDKLDKNDVSETAPLNQDLEGGDESDDDNLTEEKRNVWRSRIYKSANGKRGNVWRGNIYRGKRGNVWRSSIYSGRGRRSFQDDSDDSYDENNDGLGLVSEKRGNVFRSRLYSGNSRYHSGK